LFLFVVASGIRADSAAEIRQQLFRGDTHDPQCEEVAERAATLILNSAYEEWQIVREWTSRCETSESLTLYRRALEPDGSADLPVDRALKRRIDLTRRTKKPTSEFSRLLRATANAANAQTEDGKLIRSWFVDGYYAYISLLESGSGGRLREFAREDRLAKADGLAIVLAVTGGSWLPSQQLAKLGNQPSLGFLFSLSLLRFQLGMQFDFRFGESPEPYAYLNPNSNSLQTTRKVNSLYFAPELRYEFLRWSVFSLLAAGGIGYDLLTHYSVRRYSGEKPAVTDSLSTSLGLVIRMHFNDMRTIFTEIGFKRHFVGFAVAPGADDLSGNYSTVLFAVGFKLLTED
jgi:hypothetical protein